MLYVRREGTYSSAKVERSLCDSLQANSPCGGIARIHAKASREKRRECEALRPSQLRRSRACSLAAHLARHTWRAC